MSETIDSQDGASIADDAYGQAALALVESLLHELLARGALTADQTMTVLTIAHDAQFAIADDRLNSPAARSAVGLLAAIARSFQADRTGAL